uniref:Uncharacterized protein n=1 Tax=Kwoniella pini CBS 10737 TaxID=1296096 RepID=A0A1B9I2P6_9TREE|nr:uncharacterized protein I206_04340 [Kwoniella pini CBS 10737]OCF49813.1 hypothetical protein I206_04340 [Kwoniella pini CBS 10737]
MMVSQPSKGIPGHMGMAEGQTPRGIGLILRVRGSPSSTPIGTVIVNRGP